MKKALLKLKNGGQIKVEVNLTTQSPKIGDPKETENRWLQNAEHTNQALRAISQSI